MREARSGRLAGEGRSEPLTLKANDEQLVDLRIPIRDCRLWSPEDPFLYELEASTGEDTLRTRFGMREFRLDHATGRAMLNGRPYFLRGSNVTLYRFFEDAQCADLPWREDWVRRLHRAFKSMHWNALRYCIGFPPEFWYRHRRRGRHPDPGRVPDLARAQVAGGAEERGVGPRNTPNGCRSGGTIRAW